MAEASDVASLGDDGQCVDRANPGDFAQVLIICALMASAIFSIISRCRIRLRASASTIRNMVIAGESSGMGSAMETLAVW